MNDIFNDENGEQLDRADNIIDGDVEAWLSGVVWAGRLKWVRE